MKITLQYLANNYGNDRHARQYEVAVQKNRDVEVTFTFKERPSGRGANPDNRGLLKAAHLSLPPEQAVSIAHALLTAARSGNGECKIALDVEETKKP